MRERGIISVEIASALLPQRFFELYFIQKLIDKHHIADDDSFEERVEYFHKNYKRVNQLFFLQEYAKTKLELTRLKREWLKQKYPDTNKI